MCILLERKGYRRAEILALHRAYILEVLLSSEGAEDPKTGLPRFLSKDETPRPHNPNVALERLKKKLRLRGIPESQLDAEVSKVHAQQAALLKEAEVDLSGNRYRIRRKK